MKANERQSDADQDGLYRVRHTKTGLYVARSVGYARRDDDLADALNLFLDRQVNAVKAKRTVAGKTADVWIALTGDHGIEIEPVEG